MVPAYSEASSDSPDADDCVPHAARSSREYNYVKTRNGKHPSGRSPAPRSYFTTIGLAPLPAPLNAPRSFRGFRKKEAELLREGEIRDVACVATPSVGYSL